MNDLFLYEAESQKKLYDVSSSRSLPFFSFDDNRLQKGNLLMMNVPRTWVECRLSI